VGWPGSGERREIQTVILLESGEPLKFGEEGRGIFLREDARA